MKTYKVTKTYVDFPMGASPAYNVQCNLTKEEATKLAENLNAKEANKKEKGFLYIVFDVVEG